KKMISDAGYSVSEVSEYTEFPEMMDGRVKTLHPLVHGGLLGRRGVDADVMVEHGIREIDLLVVNLYPFESTIAADPTDLAAAIENIDIGGPAMLRSGAKNFQSVAVVTDEADYASVISELRKTGGSLSLDTRYRLAVKAFEMVARYDAAISNYLSSMSPSQDGPEEYSDSFALQFRRAETMRYGENPHQSAAFYTEMAPPSGSVATARQHQGKAMSYNNVADTDAALQCVQAFSEPACVIVKHANPCGVAVAASVEVAYEQAFSTDPTSAFGGVIAFNRVVSAALANEIIERQFSEVIVAPGFEAEALSAFAKKKNVRVLEVSKPLAGLEPSAGLDYKRVTGGLLVQQADTELLRAGDMRVVSEREPTSAEQVDLIFAWTVAKYVKSNAIVYAKNGMTIGVGAGQMARVMSAKIAGIKAEEAGLEVEGSVMASDAFFPFRDSIDAAAGVGITAVIQPGGSMRDQEVIDAVNEAGMTMILTGMRHFRH
ncbi:MAG: phosphoribosylaminoimidazolecarboxamide formyltransferase/IMP cyclohydrolase, partial [Candidatus Azotimanducaceae bacterium]